MDLQALFKRKTTGPAAAVAEDPVQEARTRARRRLIGAALLLVAGVVAFPLLFETQPRPVALNTPIQVAGREAPPASVPAAPVRAAAQAPAASAAEAVAPVEPEPPDTAASAASAAASAAAPKAPRVETIRPTPGAAPAANPVTPATAVAAAAPSAKPASAGGAGGAGGAAATAGTAGTATAAASEAAASAAKGKRYVVQVGAFADASAAREVRLKVEKLGLKTYTQVVDVDGGKRTRVRVGPYERREDAQKTAERLKAAGLGSSTVLTL